MSFFSAVSELLHPAPPPSAAVQTVLDRVAEVVAPILKADPAFERHLQAPVEYALGYCDGLIAGLPGPVEISHHAFATDPLVHALFATADDISQMLGRSQAVRDYLADPACYASDHFYALFAARRHEKRQLGMSVQGDLVQTDVPQRVLYFADQTLVEPSCSLEQTLRKLHLRAIDSLLLSFHDHVEALRAEREGLRSDLSVERAHLTVLKGATAGPAYTVHTRHIDEIDTQLRRAAAALLPENLVNALAEFLHTPEASLNLTPVSISIDRMGVVSDAGNGSDVHTINFPELNARDRRHYLVMLARVDREEARAAVERVRDQQHRFMLI